MAQGQHAARSRRTSLGWSTGHATAQKTARRRFHHRAEAAPGIGPWTAQGALLVALRREDVVLPGDLALRKAVRSAYHLDHLPSQEEVLEIAEKWRPFRSLATSYLFAAALEPDDFRETS